MVGFVLKKTFYSFGDLRKARSCTIEGHIRSRSHEVHQEVTEKDYNFKSKVMFWAVFDLKVCIMTYECIIVPGRIKIKYYEFKLDSISFGWQYSLPVGYAARQRSPHWLIWRSLAISSKLWSCHVTSGYIFSSLIEWFTPSDSRYESLPLGHLLLRTLTAPLDGRANPAQTCIPLTPT